MFNSYANAAYSLNGKYFMQPIDSIKTATTTARFIQITCNCCLIHLSQSLNTSVGYSLAQWMHIFGICLDKMII